MFYQFIKMISQLYVHWLRLYHSIIKWWSVQMLKYLFQSSMPRTIPCFVLISYITVRLVHLYMNILFGRPKLILSFELVIY